MNQTKADFIFHTVEYEVLSWIADIMKIPFKTLFGEGIPISRPLYINKSFRRFYEIKAIMAPVDYKFEFQPSPENDAPETQQKHVLEAAGFIMYGIKTVFMAYIPLIKTYLESQNKEPFALQNDIQKMLSYEEFWGHIGIALDGQNNTYYLYYVHPDLKTRDEFGQLMHKLLTEKKTLTDDKKRAEWDMHWSITMQQFNNISETITNLNIEPICDALNAILKTQFPRIGVSISEIKESDIPHHFRVSNIPKIEDLA